MLRSQSGDWERESRIHLCVSLVTILLISNGVCYVPNREIGNERCGLTCAFHHVTDLLIRIGGCCVPNREIGNERPGLTCAFPLVAILLMLRSQSGQTVRKRFVIVRTDCNLVAGFGQERFYQGPTFMLAPIDPPPGPLRGGGVEQDRRPRMFLSGTHL